MAGASTFNLLGAICASVQIWLVSHRKKIQKGRADETSGMTSSIQREEVPAFGMQVEGTSSVSFSSSFPPISLQGGHLYDESEFFQSGAGRW